jgi:SAM-dependent methyltransferase
VKTSPKSTPGKTKPGGAVRRPKAKAPKAKRPKPPAKTMMVPKPATEVLRTESLPDVRRASVANARRLDARGLLRPDSGEHDPALGPDMTDEGIDASLMMSTLAVDVRPRIEDNYDYSILDEFRDSRWCPRPTRMVNTGCGGGEAAVYFGKLGFRCVGIDSDRSQIGLARERAWLAGVEIDFMVGDLFETPNLLPAESFGLALDRGAFHKLDDDRERRRFLANIHRLLFRGGVFLLSAGFFPLPDGKKPRSRKAAERILLAEEGGVVVNELQQAGFSLCQRALRQTADSGDLGELLLYLRK